MSARVRPQRLAPRLVAALLLIAPLCIRAAPCARGQDDRSLVEFAQPLDPAASGIGEVVPDLSFVDLDGKSGHLSDFADRRALVVVIRDVGCPVSKRYGLRTAEIEKAFDARNVAFLYVNTSRQDSDEECRGEAKEYGFAGRYVHDLSQRFGWHLKVRTTSDVFVLDGERKLRYRGAIDDQFGVGVTREKATREYLKEALEALLARHKVADPAMTAPGCALDFTVAPPAEPAGPAIPWHGKIEQIVQARCQACHHEGGAGPFALLESDDVAGRAAEVRRALLDRRMPPWFATPESGPFVHDVAIRDEEKLDLLKWLQSDRVEGDPKDAPPPREWPTGWQIGEPDLVFELPAPFDIPASGVIDYKDVDVPTRLDHDVWIQAIQVLCENPGVCHHVLVLARYPEEQASDFVDSYLPGKGPTIYPEGMASLLEKGAVLRFNLHYTPNGKPVKERTKIGFKLAKAPPQERVVGRIVRQYHLTIPPGDDDFRVTAEWKIPFDTRIRRLVPHMHLRGKTTKVELVAPDGTTRTPLDLWRWHPNWQFGYELAQPIAVEKGTLLRCTCVYDNSKNNPFNPDPTKTVRQGKQIWEEMAGCFVEWIQPVRASHPRPKEPPEDE